MTHTLPSIVIIGAGKVGRALARLLNQANYRVSAVSSRTEGAAAALAVEVGAVVAAPVEAARLGDLVLLTVPDDALYSLSELLRPAALDRSFVHTSGAHSLDVLAPLAAAGASVGSLHPALPFADVDMAAANFAGTTCAVEADRAVLRHQLANMVVNIGGRPLLLPPGQKALYHAALVLASNYTVTLYALAEQLLTNLGASREDADAALNRLVAGTVANIAAKGIPDALTGPLMRADVGTVSTHLRALDAANPALGQLYRQLALHTLPLAAARGISTDAVEKRLDEPPSE